MTSFPEIAIIDPNTLSCMALRSMLETIIPQVTVRTFSSFSELMDDTPDMYFHYFAASQIVLEHTAFFLERKHKTMVLTAGMPTGNTFANTFHILNIYLPEEQLVKDLLRLHQGAHAHRPSSHHTITTKEENPSLLSQREIEVLTLLVKGYINKEVADQLNISLTTVISHRKNIIEKLGIRSISGLTIYAVMNGYVEANQI